MIYTFYKTGINEIKIEFECDSSRDHPSKRDREMTNRYGEGKEVEELNNEWTKKEGCT
tara:strand:- start:184 stop:357 length:174 start_codon:yes stop_codon:yes gene_type:complete